MRYVFTLFFALLATISMANDPIVIAHRGASGYVAEHTAAAKAMAHAQQADFIEQDVVLSKDGQFIVSHDITMEDTTNVEQLFPKRARNDGKFYFADFDASEIASLHVHQRSRHSTPNPSVADADASNKPLIETNTGHRVLTLEQEIRLLQQLRATTGREAGLYIELKAPSFHRREFGYAMGEKLLKELDHLGVQAERNKCFIQCFEPEELKDLHDRCQCRYPLIQLLGREMAEEQWKTVASYAQGIGPSLELLAKRTENGLQSTGLVEKAHQLGLQVHPYTVRRDYQPKWSESLEETHQFLLEKLQVDGFFTDFPDLGRDAVTRWGK